jgi:uncharacterized protein YkwD
MKAKLLRVLLLVATVHTLSSCTPESINTVSDATISSEKKVYNYTYSTAELETMTLINNYRVSLGLNELKQINYISLQSEEHNKYMIANNDVNHDGFVTRSENIMKVLGAKLVGENVAYNFTTPQAVFNAWILSPQHKKNIEGNYTDFGISIRENDKGQKYYTNIFAQI